MNDYYNSEDSAKRVEDFKKAVNIMEKAISKAFFNGYGLMFKYHKIETCLLYTSPSPRDRG